MFNLLVAYDPAAWENGDAEMSVDATRFKEYSGAESQSVTLDDPGSLKALEIIQAVLLYENGVEDPPGSVVRIGRLRNIRVEGKNLFFHFDEEGRIPRQYIEGNEEGLQIGRWELTRTHWAIKDGALPREVLEAVIKTRSGTRRSDAWANRSGSQPYHLKVVLASPSDVQEQREIVAYVVGELNRMRPATHGIALDLFRWEVDARPGFHAEGGQALIDKVLRIEDADLLVGIFWHRFGSKVSDGRTGTEHEIHTAIMARSRKGQPEVMLYFCQRNPRLADIDPDQLKELRAFQAAIQGQGLYRTFEENLLFERAIREHLIGWATDIVAEREKE